jgi:hypothetical protein
MISGTYFISAVGLFLLGLLFNNGTLGLGGFMVVLCATFFFASAAASAGYLTVSEPSRSRSRTWRRRCRPHRRSRHEPARVVMRDGRVRRAGRRTWAAVNGVQTPGR